MSFKGGREGNHFHCVVLQGGVFYCIVYYWVASSKVLCNESGVVVVAVVGESLIESFTVSEVC